MPDAGHRLLILIARKGSRPWEWRHGSIPDTNVWICGDPDAAADASGVRYRPRRGLRGEFRPPGRPDPILSGSFRPGRCESVH